MTESADLIAGRYRLAAQIGIGGMGVVWRARDEVLGRTVALKELAVPSTITLGHGEEGSGDESARRAMREARIAARLHHPNVIGIYDIVDHAGRPFLVMEYLASRSLSQLMASGELLLPTEAARIGAQLAGALTAAHAAGIVHRDVKPGNILLGDDGSVKLTDFGISRAVGDTTVTASGILLGTLGYIAPEVAQGQHADARSDVYALGATLYAAVEGHAPFGNGENAVALLYRIVHEQIIPAQHAGPLEPVLLRMLERDPALRLTMPQAQRALETIETGAQLPPSEELTLYDATLPATAAALAATEIGGGIDDGAVIDVGDGGDDGDHGDGDGGGQRDQAKQRPSRRVLIAVLIVAALLALGGWALSESLGHGAASPTAGSGASATSHAASPRPSSPSPSAAPPSSSPSSHAATTAASKAAAPPASQSPQAPPASANQNLSAQLVSTIVNYYKLMPGNLDAGWGWMTADYQTYHAGGRSGYDSFWAQVQSVTVSNVSATPPSTVVATVDYYYKNGTIIEERTQYGLVFQQGRWKIASSSVLSHQSR